MTYLLAGKISTSGSVINFENLNQDTFSCDVTCTDGTANDVKILTIVIRDVNEAPDFIQTAYSITADEGAVNLLHK